ncbi:chemotaxis protein CheA [bacterium BMS3Bbin12]|nr:chemotaxis protein CheA [bacterium BMS3Abin12]GBE47789.1 chemotaxis protein CheA [bacterium BMS3Bbin12]GBE49899.1 chemotaxis protein CheA [bacterium BMS3Bbin13]HDJ86763.1 chemotaxis protein CheA [Chromatiales bacterium]HDK03384.1 chemotaxis protein CheA [Gammaproteobacteria bacterium]
MADTEDDILQDFLVEGGELLEQLGEQLVDLERRPQDKELLNAVFRGFHTVKGGAGFLNLTPLVEVCHHAEDVFNLLRQGERTVDAALMDTVLRVLDTVNAMFAEVREGRAPTPAGAELLAELARFSAAPGPQTPSPPPPEARSDPQTGGPAAMSPEGTDAEFEMIRDALGGAAAPKAPAAPAPAALSAEAARAGNSPAGGTSPAAADTISDTEFEALLDDLYGAARAPGAEVPPAEAPARPPAPTVEKGVGAPPAKAKAGSGPATGTATATADTTVRVDTRRLDEIMNLVGELVLVRNRLETLKATIPDGEIAKAVANLGLVTADLQTAVMKTRMQPVRKVFGRFPRVVRDLARSLDKEVHLEMVGEETDLDKNLVEAIADPLVHLVRNAVDHGIESPAVREAAGKPRAGTVVLSAAQEGDHILLTIEDDGAGMDPGQLRDKAVEKGVMDAEAAARLSDHDAFHLIFRPGFSTKSEISDISGRGVGLDVVKTRIAQLNGSVEVDSRKGVGSTLRIKVPLTLAILPTLMVALGRQIFALPLAGVSEIFDLDVRQTNVVNGQEVVMTRGCALPLFFLHRWLTRDEAQASVETRPVVVVHVGNQRIGFVVDRLVGQEEVVIKPLGALVQGLPGLAGATITGDGKIALILDVPSLLKAYAHRH